MIRTIAIGLATALIFTTALAQQPKGTPPMLKRNNDAGMGLEPKEPPCCTGPGS